MEIRFRLSRGFSRIAHATDFGYVSHNHHGGKVCATRPKPPKEPGDQKGRTINRQRAISSGDQ
jgi:hypothetical protein